jgi:peptidyl-prolyl cis-trans isomerase C
LIKNSRNLFIPKYFVLFFAIMLFCTVFSLHIVAQENNSNSNESLAIINGEIITLEQFEQFWSLIPDNYKVQLNKEDILDQLITQTLLIQNADELNLREDPEISFQIKNAVDQILIQSLLQKEIIEKISLTDEDINTYYEENKENYWQEEEIHALNILVEDQAQAENIVNQLNEGNDFSTLAKEFSISSSASEGGDIGFVTKGTLKTEIEEQLFILNPGEVSEIIPTENGFHIFKVLEKNPSGYLGFDEVKNEIEGQLLPLRQQEAFDEYLKNIEENATIDKNTELLKEEETSEESVEEIKEEKEEE